MNEDKVTGTAKEVAGKVQGAAGDAVGDAKTKAEGTAREVSGKAQQAYGDAKEAVQDTYADAKDKAQEVYGDAKAKAAELSEDAQSELSRLKAQVEELLRDRVKPALSDAAAVAGDYAQQAKGAVMDGAGRASSAVKQQPFASLAMVAVVAFVIGRLSADRD